MGDERKNDLTSVVWHTTNGRRHPASDQHATNSFQSRFSSRCSSCKWNDGFSFDNNITIFQWFYIVSSTFTRSVDSSKFSCSIEFDFLLPIHLVNDRLENLERETNVFRSQINQAFVSPLNDSVLNRTTTGKKSAPSARQVTASRSPLLSTNRKTSNDDISTVMTNDGPFSRPLPHVPVNRSKSLQAGPHHSSGMSTTMNNEEMNILRSYKIHLEQMLRKDAPPYSDLKIPTYNSIEDVIRANEVSGILFVVFVKRFRFRLAFVVRK